VAFFALETSVMPNQWEGCIVMIEGSIPPAIRIMACSAIRAELAIMGIFCRVAGVTILWSPFIDTVRVTGLACQACMFSGQRECGVIVIEGYIRPLRGLVAGSAICPELAIVLVFCRVAGVTIFRCAFIDTVRVARLASDGGVSSR
jgi:hypothetical protein